MTKTTETTPDEEHAQLLQQLHKTHGRPPGTPHTHHLYKDDTDTHNWRINYYQNNQITASIRASTKNNQITTSTITNYNNGKRTNKRLI